MRKWPRLLFALLLVAILGGLAWLLLRPAPPDPLYNGKPLTYWLQGYSYRSTTNEPTEDEARSAVAHLGADAIPTLLRLLATPDNPLKDHLFQLSQRQHFFRVPFTSPMTLTHEAWQGFEALGPGARRALPQLTAIYDQRPNLLSRQIILVIIAGFRPPAKEAIPLLIRATTDTDAFVRNNAVHALSQTGGEPALIVPVLTKCLADPFDNTRANAAKALAGYGTNAESAVPALIKLIAQEQTNTVVATGTMGGPRNFDSVVGPNNWGAKPGRFGNINILGPATAALKAIDPEAAAKAGIK